MMSGGSSATDLHLRSRELSQPEAVLHSVPGPAPGGGGGRASTPTPSAGCAPSSRSRPPTGRRALAGRGAMMPAIAARRRAGVPHRGTLAATACRALTRAAPPIRTLVRASTGGRHRSYSAHAPGQPSRTKRWRIFGRDYLRTRNRRIVTAPDRVLSSGSRSILARPGEEKRRVPSPSRTGRTNTMISSTSPRRRH